MRKTCTSLKYGEIRVGPGKKTSQPLEKNVLRCPSPLQIILKSSIFPILKHQGCDVAVSKNRGTFKMDGENNGTPY